WRNVDRIDLSEWARANGYAFMQWDLANALPYDDQIVDLIFLSHVLEHFEYAAGKRLLVDCRRALKPDGMLRIAVPDAEKLLALYRADQLSTLQEICGNDHEGGEPIQLLHELLYGGDHRAIYDQRTLARSLHEAGFTRVKRSSFGTSSNAVMRRETID